MVCSVKRENGHEGEAECIYSHGRYGCLPFNSPPFGTNTTVLIKSVGIHDNDSIVIWFGERSLKATIGPKPKSLHVEGERRKAKGGIKN